MQRAFLALNMVLTVVLTLLVWQFTPSQTVIQTIYQDAKPDELPRDAITLVTRLSDSKFTVCFDRPMVNEGQIGRLLDSAPVSLSPYVAIETVWKSDRTLECRLPADMPRSGSYNVHLSPSLKSLDEKYVGTSRKLSFVMPGVKILDISTVIAEEDQRVIHLKASHELVEDSLKSHLSIVDDEGQFCPYELEKDPESLMYKAVLPQDCKPLVVDVKVDKGLQPVNGYPTSEIFARKLHFFDELHVRNVYTRDGDVYVAFNRYLDDEVDKDLIELNPPVPFEVHDKRYRICLDGDFVPGSPLTITFKKGFPGHGNHRLDADTSRDVSIGDLSPYLSFSQNGNVLSALARPQIKIEGVNVDNIECAIRPVYPNNFVEFAKQASGFDKHCQEVYGEWKEVQLKSGAHKNKIFEKTIDIKPLITGSPSGLFEILLWDHVENDHHVRKFVQVTDLGLAVRASESSMAVAVSSLALNQPVVNAKISVLSKTNQILATAETDNTGVALLNYEPLKSDHAPFLIQAKTQNDLAYVDLDGYAVELSSNGLGGSVFHKKGNEAYVWVDQGVVRPGEAIRMTSLLRDKFGKAPSGYPVFVSWIPPHGKPSEKMVLETSGSGFVHVEKQFSTEAVTGAWKVELSDGETNDVVGRASFKVEAFVPQRIEVAVESLEAMVHGADAKIKVISKWLEGAPATGLTVNVFPRFDTTRLAFEQWPQYVFGMDAGDTSPGAGRSVSSVIGDDGTVEISVPIAEAENHKAALRASIHVEVMDPSGRVVAAGLREPIYDKEGHLGLAREGNTARAIVVDQNGERMDLSEDISFTVEERQWRWQWSESDGCSRWHHYVHSHQIWDQTSQLDQGQASIELKTFKDHGGWLVLVAKTKHHKAEMPLGLIPDKPDQLKITPPAMVQPGETFTLKIGSPFSGRAFVSLEGESILGARMVHLKEGSNNVTLTIPQDYPHANAHIVASISRSQVINANACWAKGAAAVTISRSSRSMSLGLQTPESVRPGESLCVNIKAPGAKEVYLALIDEGILQITDHDSPRPNQYFNRSRRLVATGADIRTQLMSGAMFPEELTVGGGDGGYDSPTRLEGSTSSAIETLALDSNLIQLDAEGIGICTFDLPDYEGRVRLMAIAASPDQTAATSKSIPVTGPISLKVAVPRMTAPGDEVRLSVSVRNNDVQERELHLDMSAVGGLDLTGMNQGSFHLQPGESRHLEVPARVTDRAALATLKVNAGWPGEHREVEASFDVRNPGIYEELATSIVLDDSGDIQVPGTWQGGSVEGEIIISDRPDSRLLAPLETLVGYPYGCVEQTTSKGVALFACADLLNQLDPVKAKEARQFVNIAVSRLFRMQTYHGGLGWWTNASHEYEYGSVYAADFLRSCHDRGYTIPEKSYNNLLNRIDDWMRNGDISRRCQAVSVLAGTGRPIKMWLERLTELAQDEDDKLYLSIAWSRIGEADRAQSLLASSVTTEKEVARETGGDLKSVIKTRALRLRALLLCDPKNEDVIKCVSHLESQVLAPRRLSTHELGQAILSLSHFYASLNSRAETFRGDVTIGDRALAIDGNARLPVTLSNGDSISVTGKGMAYGRLMLKGFRTDSQLKKSENVLLKRSILDVDTGKEVVQFKRGGIYEVVLELDFKKAAENFVITEVLPGGFEIDNPRLALTSRYLTNNVKKPDRTEMRDDRIIMFVNTENKGRVRYAYRIRAVFPGTYKKLPTVFESMYDPENTARLNSDELVSIAP